MSDGIREAAERLMKPEPVDDGAGMWRQAKRITTDYQEVARHVLAELDGTPPSPDLLEPLGFVDKNGEWVIKIPSVRMVLSWSPVDATLKEPGDFPMPHTMGQIRTLLRVFGVPQKELP